MFSFFKSKTEKEKEESKKSIKPKGHVFVCTTEREEGTHPCGSCAGRGGIDVLNEFIFEINERNLFDEIVISGMDCAGPCSLGPNILVYPGGVMYSQVQKSDVKKIIESHLLDSNAEKYIMNDKSISELIYWVTGKKL
ncbi:MAG: hypothetical protein RL755_1712 [Pseudomonadota bacterium]|jgi:(2Fe-2S) ferredoxin